MKECYYYLDSTPTPSYMKFHYKYTQVEFPYRWLVEENGRRGRGEPEFELRDTGVFTDNRYFDVLVEYAKASPEDLLIRITAHNRGPDPAAIQLLPTIWFHNTWSWNGNGARPRLWSHGAAVVQLDGAPYGPRWLHCAGMPEMLCTENETNVLWC